MLNSLKRLIIHPWRNHCLQVDIYREAMHGYKANRAGFPERLCLPESFAVGLPERAVELMLARLLYRAGGATLDVGHANAMACHRRLVEILPPPRNLTGIDIAEPVYNTHPLYARSVRADIAASPFGEGEFDLIWCISALEHFGMDNSGYTNRFVQDNRLAEKALLEMVRLLHGGGRMLITVPYGRFEDHGWHIVYDAACWARLLDVVRARVEVREWFFRHTAGRGWQIVTPNELSFIGYFDQANAGAAGLAAAVLTRNAFA